MHSEPDANTARPFGAVILCPPLAFDVLRHTTTTIVAFLGLGRRLVGEAHPRTAEAMADGLESAICVLLRCCCVGVHVSDGRSGRERACWTGRAGYYPIILVADIVHFLSKKASKRYNGWLFISSK